MWVFLTRQTPISSAPLRVLHVAPEPGIARRLRALPNLDYLTADLDPGRADVQMDIAAIDFPDGQFDVVLCSNVLEHVPDDARAMRELRRVLVPSGFALIDVPIRADLEDTYEDWTITDPRGRAAAFGQHNHLRWYGRSFPDHLRAAGFDVAVDPAPVSPAEAARFGFRDGEHIFSCSPAGGSSAQEPSPPR
jgi:SAM-dependent methyltransferase